MLVGLHGIIGMTVLGPVVEGTESVTETVVILHGTILAVIEIVKTARTMNGRDVTHIHVNVSIDWEENTCE